MPRLPDKSQLGGLPIPAAPGSIITGSQYGAGILPKAIGDVGGAVEGVGDEIWHQQRASDLSAAEADYRTAMTDRELQARQDPDYATAAQRFRSDANGIGAQISQKIRDPIARQQWLDKASNETNTAFLRLGHERLHREKDQAYVDAGNRIDQVMSRYGDPNLTDEQREELTRSADSIADVFGKSGLGDPLRVQHLRQTHLYGNGGALYRHAESSMFPKPGDPSSGFSALEDIEAARRMGRQPTGAAIGEPRSDGLAPITTGSGAKLIVSADHADRFKGFLDDLEANGVEVKPEQSSGYNRRNIRGTNTPSEHASGRAIDINSTDNPQGSQGQLDPDLARSLAKKWGLKWGGDFSNPDPMHFEVDKNAPPLPKKAESGVGTTVAPEDQEPEFGKGEPSARARLWARMDPGTLARLSTRAREALRSTVKEEGKDAIAYAKNVGRLPVDDNGETVLDRARRIMTPNQTRQLEFDTKAAISQHDAVGDLSNMDDAQADKHITQTLNPANQVDRDGKPLPYAIAAKNQALAVKAREKIKKAQKDDPARWSQGGQEITVDNAGNAGLGISAGGDEEEGQTSIRTRPSQEMIDAITLLNGRNPDLQLKPGPDGTITYGPSADPNAVQKAQTKIIDARLEAQKRVGIPTGDRRAITMKEAQSLLDVSNVAAMPEDDFRAAVEAAQQRAKELYGPHAKRALEDAVKLTAKSGPKNTAGIDVARQLISGQMDPDELMRAGGRTAFERGRGWFGEGMPQAPSAEAQAERSVMSGLASQDQPTFDPWTAGVGPAREPGAVPQAGMGTDIGAPGVAVSYPQPTDAQIEWMKKKRDDSSARQAFTSRFGASATKRIIEAK